MAAGYTPIELLEEVRTFPWDQFHDAKMEAVEIF